MDRLLAGLAIALTFVALGVLGVALSVGGRLAGTVLVLWLQYRGRFPMRRLLDESSEAVEDNTPFLVFVMLVIAGAAYGIGLLAASPVLTRLGFWIAILPIAVVALRFAFSPNTAVASLNADTGLNLLRKRVPRILNLKQLLVNDAQNSDPRLQAYRHAWRADLLRGLLILEDQSMPFSAAARAEMATFSADMNIRETIMGDRRAIAERPDTYLANAVRGIDKSLRLASAANQPQRPSSGLERVAASRVLGLLVFALLLFLAFNVLRTAGAGQDRTLAAVKLVGLYAAALAAAAFHARSKRDVNWFGPLVVFWLPPIALIWSLVLVLVAPKRAVDASAADGTKDRPGADDRGSPVEQATPRESGNGQ